MNLKTADLFPFGATEKILSFSVSRTDSKLHFTFNLLNSNSKDKFDFQELFQKEQKRKLEKSSRADDLWKETCLEFFIADSMDPAQNYFEFNLGKDLRWNFYQLDSYRTNLKFSEQVQQIELKISATEVSIECTDFLIGTPLFLSATAVLKTKDGKTEYHALRHASEKPDFHDRKSFVISI